MDRRLNRLYAVALALGLVACVDDAVSPRDRADEPSAGSRALGVVEITISGLGTERVSSTTLSAPTVAELDRLRATRDAGAGTAGATGGAGSAVPGSLAPQAFSLPGGDGTIQLELISTGSFTDGPRGGGGQRYLYAIYGVRNARADGTPYDTPRRNLTFYAVDTNETIDETPISRLVLFDGGTANPALAAQLVPTGVVAKNPGTNAIHALEPDVLQVVTEGEADAIEALADGGVLDVFPYGFVVRRVGSTTTRELPPDPAEDQFDGVVTFAFKVPLQASAADDAFTVSIVFLPVDDDAVRITQSLEEQTPAGRAAFEARAVALGADVRTILPPVPPMVPSDPGTARVLCSVRTAGTAEFPVARLETESITETRLTIPLVGQGYRTLPPTWRPSLVNCEGIPPVDATSFAVHGSMSARGAGEPYRHGGTFVVAPAPAGGRFFPGEEVEVTLTAGLGAAAPTVARYRTAVAGGSGTFEFNSLHDGVWSWSVAVGDLNGDGALDVVSLQHVTTLGVAVRLNQGDGTLGDANLYGTSGASVDVALGDLDRDGDLDMVVGSMISSEVSVLTNRGDGTFETRAVSAGNQTNGVALGDLDADGDLDLVVANSGASYISVLFNAGDGQFDSWTSYPTDWPTGAVALGDVDDDGDVDVVAAGHGIFVLRNHGNGTFDEGTSYELETGMIQAVALGDLDGDGDLDIVTANGDGGGVSVFINDGTGTFDFSATYPTGPYAYSVALGDIDGDGDLDLAVAVGGGSEVLVLRNEGDGTFDDPESYPVEGAATGVALGDMDGDGDLDLVVAGGDFGTYVFRNK